MLEQLIYNPISWIIIFWVVVILYAWCWITFKLEGSWKGLDKSINFKEKK